MQRLLLLFAILLTPWVAPGETLTVKPGDNLDIALYKARQMRERKPAEAVEIIFSGGVYRLPGPLHLGPEDSGTAIAPLRLLAARGAQVVLSGGQPVTRFEVLPDGSRHVVFSGVPGRIYRIQSSETMSSSESWADRMTVQADEDGSFGMTDALPLPGKRFYRAVFP